MGGPFIYQKKNNHSLCLAVPLRKVSVIAMSKGLWRFREVHTKRLTTKHSLVNKHN